MKPATYSGSAARPRELAGRNPRPPHGHAGAGGRERPGGSTEPRVRHPARPHAHDSGRPPPPRAGTRRPWARPAGSTTSSAVWPRSSSSGAIAVIFSGMGSNGTAGAQAVRAVGGLVIAQEPETAKFPPMPRSVIAAHLPDYILRPAEVPEALARYAGQPYAADDGPAEASARDEQALGDVLAVLRTRTRHDFGGYRKPTILRRVRRRMGLGEFDTLADYVRALRQTPAEVTALADDLLIHVTGFFRDPEAWAALREKVIAPLAAERADGAEVRCWVSACATGEEAYTLCHIAHRGGRDERQAVRCKGFRHRYGRSAHSGSARVRSVPQRHRDRGHTRTTAPGSSTRTTAFYRVKKELRELIIFAPQNVLQDPPFSPGSTSSPVATYSSTWNLSHAEAGCSGRLALRAARRRSADARQRPSRSAPAESAISSRSTSGTGCSAGSVRRGPGSLDLPALATASPRGQAGDAVPGGRRAAARPSRNWSVGTLLDRHTPAAVAVDAAGRVVHFHGNTRPVPNVPGRRADSRPARARQRVRCAASVRTALHRASDTQRPGCPSGTGCSTPRPGACGSRSAAAPLGTRG